MPWRSTPEAQAQAIVARVVALAPTEDDIRLVEDVASDCDARVALARLAAFFAREGS